MISQPDFSTCDLCDAHKASDPAALRVLPGSRWRSYGHIARFCGPIATVRCFEDNSRIKEAVESAGDARVLVVDGGASLRRSLLGGKLAAAAQANGWAGLLIHGAVRDLAELRSAQMGILALGHVPMPTDRQGQGLFNVGLLLDGTPIRPGEWLYADEDGVLIAPGPL